MIDRVAAIIRINNATFLKVGGRTLLSRLIWQLKRLNLKDIFLWPIEKGHFLKDVEIKTFKIDQISREKTYLVLEGNLVYDHRFLKKLLETPPPVAITKERDDICGIHLKAEETKKYLKDHKFDKKEIKFIGPQDIDLYLPEIRGKLTPFILKVKNKEEAKKATWFLIHKTQKHIMDLPAKYLDPLFENPLCYLFCLCPITPNMVTLVNLLLAGFTGILFLKGYFLAGALLAYISEVLDGVDGKLARVKLIFSRLGKYEYLIDFLYEHWWYIALAFGLKSLGYQEVFYIWGLLAFADIIDNIFYNRSEAWFGQSIDLLSEWDARFRLIAGRRNIYGMVFIFGAIINQMFEAYLFAAVWAALTALIHGIRLFHYRFIKKLNYQQLKS